MSRFFFLALGCAMLLTGCVKDEPNAAFITLHSENYTPDKSAAKAMVNGGTTTWVSGEEVWINHHICPISISGSNAVISLGYSNDQNTYYAVYPASAYNSNTGASFTIDVPRHYSYDEDANGKQVVDGPAMVAYFSGTADELETYGLEFKHLTAAITVRIKNDKATPLLLERAVLFSDNYQLGGQVTISDIANSQSNANQLISPIPLTGDHGLLEGDSVTIHFDKIQKTLAAKGEGDADYVDVQIPILPVGTNVGHFTIKVYARHEGSRYVFCRTTGETLDEGSNPTIVSRNNSIGRACLGYAVAKYTSAETAGALFDAGTVEDASGNSVSCYSIGSSDELLALVDAMNNQWDNGSEKYYDGNYLVTNDIDLNGAEIAPMRYYNTSGEGCVFDGDGHSISNFTLSTETSSDQKNLCGFFTRPEGDGITIRDLTIEDAEYEFEHVNQKVLKFDNDKQSCVGGIFGYVDKENIVIEGCTVNNLKVGAAPRGEEGWNSGQVDAYVGGIVGLVNTGCTIRNCTVTAVTVDNSNDVSGNSGKIVDQFGGAIGRIDVGDPESSNTYYDATSKKWVVDDSKTYNKAGVNAVRVVITNFTYRQGPTTLEFVVNLKNVRYGGVVANITRAPIVEFHNCVAEHNVKVNKPTNQMFLGGLIGCVKSTKLGLLLDSDCNISGSINNNAVSSYTTSYLIEKYWTNGGSGSVTKLSGSASTCTNSLSVTGLTSGFNNANQAF